MATRSSRDVRMTLSIETLGQDEIRDLQKAVQNLAAEGGSAAPEFQALADEIGRLGAQNEAVSTVRRLSDETAELKTRQEAAAASVEQMQAKLVELKNTTDAARAGQQKTAESLLEWRKNAVDAAAALSTTVKTTDAAGKKTAEYKAEIARLTAAQAEARKQIVSLSAEMTKANAEVRDAEAAQLKLEKAIGAAGRKAAELGDQVSRSQTELERASGAARELGVATDDLATAELDLLTAFQGVAREANRAQSEVDALAQAERTLADSRAFEQQLEDARALGEAINYVQWWKDALKEADEQKRKMADADASAAWQREADALVEAAEAQQRLTRAQEVAIAVQRELQDQAAFEKQAEANRKLREAADYTRWWSDAMKEADNRAEQMAAAAREAGEAIDSAFRTVGVRSAESLRAEIEQVRAAMKHLETSGAATGAELRGAFAAGNARIKELERDIRNLTGQLTLADKASRLFKNSMGQIAAGNLVADAIASIVERVKEMGREFIRAIVQLDQMRRGLNAIYKDTATTARQIDFLRRTASEAGVSFGGLSAEFVKFSASMKNANVPLEEANALFASVVRASTSLGLGAEATAGSLNALGQMASKGVVSMEELRQQLGDRLPGAFGLMAQGLGITESQLVKLVETGRLATRDAIVPLTKALTTLHGETNGLLPTWERLLGALRQAGQNAGDAGWTQILTLGLKALSAAAYAVVMPISLLTELSGALARSLGVLVGAVTTLTNPWEALKEIWGDADERLTKLNESFVAVVGGAKEQRESVLQAAAGNRELMQAINGAKDAADLQYLANLQASDSTANLSAQLVQYNVAAEAALKSTQQRTVDTERLAKAARDEGAALVAVAKLRGDEAGLINASAQAANLYAGKLKEAADSKAEEVRILEHQLRVTQQNLTQRQINAEQIASETRSLRDKIEAAKAEESQARQAAAAAESEAKSRRLAAETLGDQSDKLKQLKLDYEAAEQSARVLEEAERNGIATKQSVALAQERAAAALYKYRDAQQDVIKNTELRSRQAQADYQVQLAGLELQKAQLKAAEDKARADGNDFEVRKAIIAQREIEIKIVKLTVEAKIAEQNAEIALLKLKQAELDINDPLYAQKQAALELSIKAAEAAILQAKAQGEVVASMERELQALKNGNVELGNKNRMTREGNAVTNAAVRATDEHSEALERLAMKYKLTADYTERQVALLEKEIALQERRDALERRRLNIDKQGFSTDKDGNRIAMGGDLTSRTGIASFLRSAGVEDESVIERLVKLATDEKGDVKYFNNPIQKMYGDYGDTLSSALLKAAEKEYTFNKSAQALYQKRQQPASDSPAKDSSTNKTVTINVGGRSQKVNVNSDADVQNLTSILRQLETQANTAS